MTCRAVASCNPGSCTAAAQSPLVTCPLTVQEALGYPMESVSDVRRLRGAATRDEDPSTSPRDRHNGSDPVAEDIYVISVPDFPMHGL